MDIRYQKHLETTTRIVNAIEMRGERNPSLLAAIEWLEELEDAKKTLAGLEKIVYDRFKSAGWRRQHIKAIRTQMELSDEALLRHDSGHEALRLQVGRPLPSSAALAAAITDAINNTDD